MTDCYQAFIALANGEIKTYDLLCLRISQFAIPNLWKIHEEKSLDSKDGPPLSVLKVEAEMLRVLTPVV